MGDHACHWINNNASEVATYPIATGDLGPDKELHGFNCHFSPFMEKSQTG
jgi:hypothetical protein